MNLKKENTSLSTKDIISYYENEAEEVPIFGSIREIGLAENIIRVFPNKSFQRVIDIGCGDGYLLYKIREKLPQASLYGLDVSHGRINTTKENVPSTFLLRGDVHFLPFPNNIFDLVICSELLEHVEYYTKMIDELIRISKGYIIISVPNELRLVRVMCPRCKTKHYLDGHVHFFTDNKLKNIFQQRSDISIKRIRKFHTIFTYNRVTMKFPEFLRLFFDQTTIPLHKYIGFLKPNFLLIILEKRDEEK